MEYNILADVDQTPAETRILTLPSGALVSLDAIDYPAVTDYTWTLARDRQGRVRVTRRPSPQSGIKTALLHRLVAHRAWGDPGTRVVCFRNDNPLDCRRANLWVRSRSAVGQGTSGAKKRAPGASRYIGVFRSTDGRWAAQITYDTMRHFLGRFDRQTDAARAYDDIARLLFGDSAVLNFKRPKP